MNNDWHPNTRTLTNHKPCLYRLFTSRHTPKRRTLPHYCNSILYGTSSSNINKLQRVQNALARTVMNKRDHCPHSFQNRITDIKDTHYPPAELLSWPRPISHNAASLTVLHASGTIYLYWHPEPYCKHSQEQTQKVLLHWCTCTWRSTLTPPPRLRPKPTDTSRVKRCVLLLLLLLLLCSCMQPQVLYSTVLRWRPQIEWNEIGCFLTQELDCRKRTVNRYNTGALTCW